MVAKYSRNPNMRCKKMGVLEFVKSINGYHSMAAKNWGQHKNLSAFVIFLNFSYRPKVLIKINKLFLLKVHKYAVIVLD